MTQELPTLKQRLHIILLGVDDVAASATFYEALGWQRAATSH
jgi:catechol 2,3-dioxygenase-like lactoylglutathione lyase family enzyme